MKKEIVYCGKPRVAVSNDLAANFSSNLTLNQMRLVNWLIGVGIEASDDELFPLELDISALRCILGAGDSHLSGGARDYIGSVIDNLRTTTFWFVNDGRNGRVVTTTHWFEYCISYENGSVVFSFNRFLRQHLLSLSANFNRQYLGVLVALKHVPSVRLYQYLSATAYSKSVSIEFDELRRRMNYLSDDGSVNSYKEFWRFKQKILEPSIKEINEISDLDVRYSVRNGPNGFRVIDFFISPKKKFILPELPLQKMNSEIVDNPDVPGGKVKKITLIKKRNTRSRSGN